MQQSIAAILSITELFDNLTETQLELVASICESGTYEPGDVLVKEHESSSEMYIISRGGVEVLMDPTFVGAKLDDGSVAPVVLTELRQGQVFGEVALVDQGIRSATIRVSQNNTHLLRIPRERLMLLCDAYPELGYKLMKNVAADLAFKIRNTDLTIRQYQLLLSQSKRSAS
ncbi:MAG: cyclic nucleotide-binding domain-containing protein [Anaerolineales bacterium]|nr:cyclic nucleotide-binding domain-containing protein [Anaerolineales bacterium]MCA9932138.1 cyclic nucleotide-binding domain-containing protein [Anaerolineales bacterium]